MSNIKFGFILILVAGVVLAMSTFIVHERMGLMTRLFAHEDPDILIRRSFVRERCKFSDVAITINGVEVERSVGSSYLDRKIELVTSEGRKIGWAHLGDERAHLCARVAEGILCLPPNDDGGWAEGSIALSTEMLV